MIIPQDTGPLGGENEGRLEIELTGAQAVNQ